jgi:hypothetical protein
VSRKVFLSSIADIIHPTNCILNPDLLERSITASKTVGKWINPTEWLLILKTVYWQAALVRNLYVKKKKKTGYDSVKNK